MILQWFLSKTVRQATAMRNHVQKLLNHQRDILSPQAIEAIQSAMASCQRAVAEYADKPALEKQMENLEKAANKWLKPYPSAAWRENVEVLLVALAVAMGIRTFFLQPFKIPTGSMQPTLYGVTSENLINEPNFKIPTGLTRVRQWFEGVSYIHLVAENDGPLEFGRAPIPHSDLQHLAEARGRRQDIHHLVPAGLWRATRRDPGGAGRAALRHSPSTRAKTS